MSKGRLPETVAIIGSFHDDKYEKLLEDWRTFTAAGLEVTSPKGTPVIAAGISFVRFASDGHVRTDPQVQQVALHRILRADFVYAELPDGYVGRTACYEIGRILSRNRPLYFSELPADLPLEVPSEHIASAEELVERFRVEAPHRMLDSLRGESLELEQNLLRGTYLNL